ncbi:MAG: ATP-grasp domain-containing protein [Balneolaceae bacterium]
MKKILMLGASYLQVPAIKYAKEAGYHVITADYKPDNPGHYWSDEYHNISTVDKDAILLLAEQTEIDGILSYASDPGAPTAAYVSEKLGLPGNPYRSVLTLQRKDLFRNFLKEHGFPVPESRSFTSEPEAEVYAEFLLKSGSVIVKPVDSSGSKGVTRIENRSELGPAFQKALTFSREKKVVVEEFIHRRTYQMDGDGFVWNGELIFSCFGTQHIDDGCNLYVPVGSSFPYVEEEEIQRRARQQVNRVMGLLGMRVGGLNIEFITSQDGRVYLLEIGPRSGGNLIPEVIRYATGVDLIRYAVEGALGKDCSDLQPAGCKGYFSSYLLHARRSGTLQSVRIDDQIRKHIVEETFISRKGEKVERFDGSHHILGTYILQFESKREMLEKMDRMHDFISAEVA